MFDKIKKSRFKLLLFIFGIIISCTFLFYFVIISLENEDDPDWAYVDSLLERKDIYTIDQKIPFLDSVYKSIQKDSAMHRKSAIELINKPKLPIYEYRKFADAVSFVHKNKFTLIFGTQSTGRSTISNMISRTIAVDSCRILYLQCVPKLEVEYHKEYIGYITESGTYKKGKLLNFFEKCRADTMHNYVFLIDDIDKIQPATLFGAPIWAKLKDSEYAHPIEGYAKNIIIPDNFYMISVAALGQNSELKFSEEHYSRISPKGIYNYIADPIMFYLLIKKNFDLSKPDEKKHFKNIVYFYIKANQYIEKTYGTPFLVGQKSSVKKYLKKDQFEDYINSFVTQVNALEPNPIAKKEDFNNILFSIKNNGKLKNSNLFGKIYVYLVYDLDILNQIVITLFFMLCGTIIGWIYSDKRKSFYKFIESINTVFVEFESGKINREKLKFEISIIKKRFETLLNKGKIKQNEAIFFYNIINDKLATNTLLEDFFDLFNSCISDEKITKKEHIDLLSTVEKIKPYITEHQLEIVENKLNDLNKYKSITTLN